MGRRGGGATVSRTCGLSMSCTTVRGCLGRRTRLHAPPHCPQRTTNLHPFLDPVQATGDVEDAEEAQVGLGGIAAGSLGCRCRRRRPRRRH